MMCALLLLLEDMVGFLIDGLNGDDDVRGEGGMARREESLWIVVGRSCFSSEVLGLLLLWFDCAAGLGCVLSSEQRAVFIRYLRLIRKERS